MNVLLYHFPLYRFAVNNLNYNTLSGFLLLCSLFTLTLVLNALIFYILVFLSSRIGKITIILLTNLSALAVYFVNTYNVIIDKTMMGNVFNTNFDEASSFWSFKLIFYIIFLGILPSFWIAKTKIKKPRLGRFFAQIGFTLIFIIVFVYANATNWLWIDKNSKALGGLVMPWSYVVNTHLFFYHKSQENKQQILLPNARIKNNQKSVAVLVIGESARSANFSLYGYPKNTNPLLSKIDNLHHYDAQSCATYTTAGVKCILEHENTNKLYEILPNYLFRNDVEVIWRTTNWGEPTVKINHYLNKGELEKMCEGDNCDYDELLLNRLNEQILASEKSKVLVVLHTSTSHGPTYFKKYPPQFKKFSPVCESVELNNCTQEELINAYDNTIVYTDYILAKLIEQLKALNGYNSSMFFVSDHGESLGENNLYMHGIPASMAPQEQLEIPFLVWLSDNSKTLRPEEEVSQHHVFHSILDFLAIESPIFNKNKSLFESTL